MQSVFKILSQQAREDKFSRQEVCKSLQKWNFITARRRKNFQLLVFGRRAYAAYVLARSINFNCIYFDRCETAPKAAVFRAA